ncbi:MAG: alpha-amylase [Bacteroidia bacterium]|nr:alpha-amylase [Bacteroidia bacterium]
MKIRFLLLTYLLMLFSCTSEKADQNIPIDVPFSWSGATIYFLMTDRFYDGDPQNNFQHDAANPPAAYRGFMGGDIKGITDKIKEGYFTKLGVDAIWFTPVVEQIKGSVDEGTGNSFAFHGYWTRDWTALDQRFGTAEELRELVKVAHQNDLKILIDAVANHTGPVTEMDSQWPDDWVKTGPRCSYTDAKTTIDCTLVENLPDIKTESDKEVELPLFLLEKWKNEGRYEQEITELDQWFETTGYKRTPVNYILKWLVDFIKEYGIDGYRVDTVKHTEAFVWSDLYRAAVEAFESYKDEHPEEFPDDAPFYMVGEVYNYYASGGREFDYGDQKVDFFDHGFHSLINFDFKTDATREYEEIFVKYDTLLNGPLEGKSVVNYISSHDDGAPFDKERKMPLEAGTKLMLTQGSAQIYYGDETARRLNVKADGDAVLRSPMNWQAISSNDSKVGYTTKDVLEHWRKLGQFRKSNPAIANGKHQLISSDPYVFKREWTSGDYTNKVVVGLGLEKGQKEINVANTFGNGVAIIDQYSGKTGKVSNGKVILDTPFDLVLLSIN